MAKKKNTNCLHENEVIRLHELQGVVTSDEFMKDKDIQWLIQICFRLNSKLWRANKKISALQTVTTFSKGPTDADRRPAGR